jgi:hypothetical protein
MLCKLFIVSLLFVATSTAAPQSALAAVEVIERDVHAAIDPLSLGPWINHTYTISGASTDVALPTPEVFGSFFARAFTGLTGITKAVCNNAAPRLCTSLALATGIKVAINVWEKATNKRDIYDRDQTEIEYLPGFAPTESCGGLCALRAGVPKDGTFNHVAWVTINGTGHTVHFAHGSALGNLTHIRAVQENGSDDLTKRYYSSGDQNDGGVVADYYFNDVDYDVWYNDVYNVGTYPRAGEGNDAGEFVEGVLWNANSLAACVSDYYNGNDAFHGVASIGWNNQGFVWGSGGAPNIWDAYNSCGYGDAA